MSEQGSEMQVRRAMVDSVAGLTQPDRWTEVVEGAERSRRLRRRGYAGGGVLALAAAAALAVALLPTHPAPRHSVIVGHGSGTTLGTPTSVPAPSPTTATTLATGPAPTSVISSATTPGEPALPSGYVGLYPFSSPQGVSIWEAAYATSGAQPWHLDPGQTALSFTGFLGYTEVNKVVSSTVNGSDAHVSVGYTIQGGGPTRVAAVVHLVRYGSGARAPWEVVGTDDTTLSLTSPAYDSRTGSPIQAGGRITGVDESISVEIIDATLGQKVGSHAGVPAGGTNSPWSETVAFSAHQGDVLIVAASTGGHVAKVERFAVTGIHSK